MTLAQESHSVRTLLPESFSDGSARLSIAVGALAQPMASQEKMTGRKNTFHELTRQTDTM